MKLITMPCALLLLVVLSAHSQVSDQEVGNSDRMERTGRYEHEKAQKELEATRDSERLRDAMRREREREQKNHERGDPCYINPELPVCPESDF